MRARPNGYFEIALEGVQRGTRYSYRLDGRSDRPDPASRYQPEGVHGPSQVVEPDFEWRDHGWTGLALEQCIFYELHVGTFTPEGTFDAVIPHLDYLKDVGITVVEMMPLAQFPGGRNWGYDGVSPFAAQNSYGGPEGLKRLVDACHLRGLGVALDVVYNHLGPEGNYLSEFGPYFTDRYKTPWGKAVNFDGAGSDEVRRFFIENALYWVTEFHIDALRLDAVHAIFDQSATPFLEELGDAVHEQGTRLNRRILAIPESALNDSRLVRAKELGGMGLDAQWNDDFHHAVRAVLTGDRAGYYSDFGDFRQIVKAYREGYVYSGDYSRYRRRRHGNSARAIPPPRLVVFAQNHDHVGNRMLGERLSTLVSFETLKLAAAAVFLSPYTPLLFMGEEYGETAPFLYFVSHGDADLVEAVRRGRKEEFASFAWKGEPPDPQAEETFLQSKLNHSLRAEPTRRTLLDFYKALIRLRKTNPVLAYPARERMQVSGLEDQKILLVRHRHENEEAVCLLHFGEAAAELKLHRTVGCWRKLLDSSEERWLGPGSAALPVLDAEQGFTLNPKSAVVYARQEETF